MARSFGIVALALGSGSCALVPHVGAFFWGRRTDGVEMVLLPFLSFLVLNFSEPHPPRCDGPLTRETVIACARAASPRLEVDREHIGVAHAERETARVLLPANPTLSGSLSHRANSVGATAINATGTLSQKIEIGGQRRRRMDVANARVSEAHTRVASTEREVAADALLAYYAVLAARAESEVVERSLETARKLEEVARERASAGVAAPIDVDLAAAERTRTEEQAILARGQIALSLTRLVTHLGLDPGATPEVRGELVPMIVEGGGPESRAEDARSSRPELAAEQAKRRTEQARIGLLRRSRLPSPSLSVFVQRDGFDERVIGGGLSFPIPLPAPLGRVNKGEIATARSRIRESEARTSAIRRKVTMEATTAAHAYETRRKATAVYPPEAAAQAEQTLHDLADEIAGGRLPVRDALLAQQALQDMLLRGVHARHALADASVMLILASGAPFEGGAR